MKPSLLFGILFFVLSSAGANTYYSTNGASPNSISNWHTNRNGTGSTPSNFNGNDDIFIIQTGHSIITTANWTLGGNNSKIIIETGATLQANHKITVDILQADYNGTYIHNDNSASFPGSNERTFATTSTVEINNWSGSNKLPFPTVWGNLIIDMPGYNSNINQAGNLTDIAGNFIIRSTGNSGKEFRLATNQDYTLTIGGDLIIEGGILEASSSNANADQVIIINGSLNQSGGVFTRSNNNANVLTIQFNGTNSNFSKTGGTLSDTYINWEVNASKKLSLLSDLALASSRSITVNGILDFGIKNVTGAGSFISNAGATLITSGTSGLNGSIGVAGATTLSSGSSYEFLAATTTAFPASVASIAANDIITSADVTFNKDVTVSGTLSVSSGKIIIPAANTVTLLSANAIAGSGFGASKHIVTQVNTSTGAKGYLRLQNITGTVTAPIGNGTYYLPVTLTASGTNDFSFCLFDGITANGQPNGTPFTANQKKSVVDAVWQVNRNSGSSDVMMTLAWPDALEGLSFSNLAGNQIGIAHYGAYWESAFGTGNQVSNNATRSAIVSFSPFGVGLAGSVLPLKFGDIKAVQKNSTVQIDWFSFSEYNLDHYEVERSTDGRNFISLGNVACAGNSSVRKDYVWKDHISTEGIFFYRIKGIDADTRFIYSQIVKISISRHPSNEMILYPNPVVDKRITVQAAYLLPGQYKLNVYGQNGNLVYQQAFEHSGGAISQQIQLLSSVIPGIYTLAIAGGSNIKMSKSFVVK
ncbi:MAG TPA: T9SS type A sorting domain-containing protein [Chitinophagaceae bacterium]|nr:T9SS type A sorting domain-containing protein [Chitinophagaceae bacterium]